LDLVDQLVRYCERTASEPPAKTRDELLDWVARGVRNKQAAWQLGGAEIDWVIGRMRKAFVAGSAAAGPRQRV